MILIYTFSTFPWIAELQGLGVPVVILQKLTTDLEKLKTMIEKESPTHILGIAAAEGNTSFLETKAVNSFHKKKVNKANPIEEYALEIHPLPFKKRAHATHSFCNWSAFKLAEFLENKSLQTTLSFVHIAEKDLQVLLAEIENY